MPQRSRGERLIGIKQAQIGNQLEELSRRDEVLGDPKVKKREFDVGNLVLLWSPRTESSGKLESKWDGPYVVIKNTRPRDYHLMDPQGLKLEHS
jgi:hypothetical protein